MSLRVWIEKEFLKTDFRGTMQIITLSRWEIDIKANITKNFIEVNKWSGNLVVKVILDKLVITYDPSSYQFGHLLVGNKGCMSSNGPSVSVEIEDFAVYLRSFLNPVDEFNLAVKVMGAK